MKGIKTLVVALCASLMLTACGEWSNAAKGGTIGGGSGAALGSIVGYLLSKNGKGTAIGAAVGAAVGTGAGLYRRPLLPWKMLKPHSSKAPMA